jgi:GINS complex subunit 4
MDLNDYAAPAPRLSTEPPEDDDEDGPEETLVQRLTRRWVDEREAPEVLPHCHEDITECLKLMGMQVRPVALCLLLGLLSDPLGQSTAIASIREVETEISEEEHFRFIVVQQDMERIKWVIKNLVRTRQYKVRPFCRRWHARR